MSELVYKDGGCSWHYADGIYSRTGADGRDMGRLSGLDIPDPTNVWEKRCLTAQVIPGTLGSEQLKPSEAVYAIWNHWQGVNNANNNN